MTTLEQSVREYAIQAHADTNHTYGEDKHPYSYHLELVKGWAEMFSYLLPDDTSIILAFCVCWCHDLIEDARQTFNDVKKVAGPDVAEITFLLTNLRGRNRAERAGPEYYAGIRTSEIATFVKICDRLANASYSRQQRENNGMYKGYRKENEHFVNSIYNPKFEPMFKELNIILGLPEVSRN